MKGTALLVVVATMSSLAGCGRRSAPVQAPMEQPKAAPVTGTSEAGQAPGNPEAEKAAVAATDAWLKLVDAGKYDESWKQSSKLFQKAIDQATLSQQLGTVRGSLGKVISRSVKSTQYSTSLPGWSEGEYVVIQYDTSFEKQAAAVERLTPMKEADGGWRVSGYFIK